MILIRKINNTPILAERSYCDEGGRNLKSFLDGIPVNEAGPEQQSNPAGMTADEVTSLLSNLN